MGTCNQIFCGIIFLISSVVLIYVLVKLVMLARKGYKGAIVLGALLAIFVPDPIYEKFCRSVRKAKHKV